MLTEISYIFTLKYPTVYDGCSWVKENDKYKENISKLITIQRYVKKYHKFKRFKRWVESYDFNHWYYGLDGKGKDKAIKRCEKHILKLQSH